MPRAMLVGLVAALAALLPGCTKSPVLYPNEYRQQVGAEQVKRDVEECETLAKQEGTSAGSQARDTAGRTATGAAVGAATGAVVGAIVGSAGRGAAVGAAGGGTSGLLSGLLRDRDPDPAYKAIVERCLTDRGYEPIGWD